MEKSESVLVENHIQGRLAPLHPIIEAPHFGVKPDSFTRNNIKLHYFEKCFVQMLLTKNLSQSLVPIAQPILQDKEHLMKLQSLNVNTSDSQTIAQNMH